MTVIRALFAAALLCSAVASADSRVPVPQPPKGKGDKCVMPTDDMRKNHMKYLYHQRDETMHEGIRTPRFSLKECINCHVVKGDDGKPVTYKSPKHFCNSCHSYASVKIDCFECHASVPSPGPGDKAIAQAKLFNSASKARVER